MIFFEFFILYLCIFYIHSTLNNKAFNKKKGHFNIVNMAHKNQYVFINEKEEVC